MSRIQVRFGQEYPRASVGGDKETFSDFVFLLTRAVADPDLLSGSAHAVDACPLATSHESMAGAALSLSMIESSLGRTRSQRPQAVQAGTC
jgi:hypothetical protein